MSDSISILTAPPSYDIAVQEAVELEEHESRTEAVPETSLVVLAPPAALSTEMLVDPGPMISSSYIPNVLAPPAALSTEMLVDPGLMISSSHIPNAEVRGPFAFSPLGTNAMLLLPHLLSPNSRPLYHISVSSDCFRPHICLTTIRRGGSDRGQIVAEIKRPLYEHVKDQGTVHFGSKFAKLGDMHIHKGKHEMVQQRYDWHSIIHKGKVFKWETEHHGGKVISVQCTELGVSNAPTLASFRPTNRRTQLQTLEISPEGLPFMDDIVVSCLATESRRTSKYDK